MDKKKQPRNSRIHNRFSYTVFFSLLVLFSLDSASLQAEPVGARDAEKVVRGWLKRNPEPLGVSFGKRITKTDVFADSDGEVVYYVVYVQPAGFVVVPADDEVEPIIALVAYGTYDPSPDNPLGALVSKDVPARIAAVRGREADRKGDPKKNDLNKRQFALEKAVSDANDKWAKLLSQDDDVGAAGVDEVSDVRVAPLVQSKWNQAYLQVDTGSGYEWLPLYNYYTLGPNHACGCVATAMAQLMRYHEYPTAGVGTPSFTIRVDGNSVTASLRGGDGAGGPYQWGQMPLEPNSNMTEIQRQAIGALCYDAGVAVETSYTQFSSSAGMFMVSGALTGVFGYGNAVYGNTRLNDPIDVVVGMMNPNLDANLPTLLGIWSTTRNIRHAVVCDGYGYDNGTLYHHLNMGWGGNDDAWYALPDIGTTSEFDAVTKCIYNVFKSGSGEIVSGRVIGPGGASIADATVTAHILGGTTYYTSSNGNGIYAFPNMPPYTTFFVAANKAGWEFESRQVRTGASNYDAWVSGNVWGVDFNGTLSSGSVDLERETYVAPEAVTIRVVDADLKGQETHSVSLRVCGGDTETVVLSEYPANSGILSGDIPTAEGAATTGDGTVQVLGTGTMLVIYEDSNDGTGSAIVRRDTATIANDELVMYETDFTGGLPTGWTITDCCSAENTWTHLNPEVRSSPYWTGTFMIVDCENPLTIGFDEQLITHSIDCSACEQVTLTFSHDFRHRLAEVGEVDVRVGAGDWQCIARYQGGDADGVEEIDLTSVAAGETNVQLRWYYYTRTLGLCWGIDNVRVGGVIPPERLAGDFEPDCDVDWADLAVLTEEWLTAGSHADIMPVGVEDGIVNMPDFALLAQRWFEGVE